MQSGEQTAVIGPVAKTNQTNVYCMKLDAVEIDPV